MPADLYLAPVGADKTATVVDGLLDTIQHKGQTLPKVWVLTANRRQQLNFRQRLLDRSSAQATFFNIEHFSFYALNRHLLNLAAQPARKIEPQTQLALLRNLTERLNAEGELRHFHRIASTRGFIEVLAELINELKQNGVEVEQFARAASSAKDRDIAAVYRHYQQALKDSGLVDVEGEGWLALATLRRNRNIAADVDLAIVDGFDQFTPVQALLLAELANSVPRVDITLTTLPARAGVFSRRSELTLTRLEKAHKQVGSTLHLKTLPALSNNRHPDLEQLGQWIFQARPVASGGNAIRLLAMPSESEETKAVLRAVKRQLLGGVRADDILIAIRDWDRYASHFRHVQREFELPLTLQNQPLLHKIPVIDLLIDVLDLTPHFRRSDLLDVLRSPYLVSGLSEADIDLLERISREQILLYGAKENWIEMVSYAAIPRQWEYDDGYVELTREQAENLARRLARFLEGITPPASADAASFVAWLGRLIDSNTQIEEETRDMAEVFSPTIRVSISDGSPADPAIMQRDMAALRSLYKITRDLLLTRQILQSGLGEPGEVEWHQFWSELKYALQNSSGLETDFDRNGRVLVTTATESRGLPHKHVYILGLAEGLFPAVARDDPIYLDSERERLQSQGIQLETQAERVDDRGLFAELINLPRQSLTLSRPTVKDGKIWLESYLWRSVLQAFPQLPVKTAAVGQVLPLREAASPAELMTSLADRLAQDQATGSDDIGALRAWLESHASLAFYWRRIRRGTELELSRLSTRPHDQFSGHLSHPHLRAVTERKLGIGRVWSASQLKDYGLCGFRFFAKRLLRLDEVKDPQAGFDSMQLGQLNHKILEDTYRRVRDFGLSIHEDNLDQALEIFERIALKRLDSAPQDFGFLAGAGWQAEKMMLFRRLQALIKLDFSAKSPLNRIAGDRRVYDLEYSFDDVEIDLPELGERLRLRGMIDRIDVAGGRLILVDYKTGSTTIDRSEIEAGRDFQMMTYVLALGAELDHAVSPPQMSRVMFWHLRNLKTSGEIDLDNAEDLEAIAVARARVAENLRDGRAGRFPVRPTGFEAGKCARYCEYGRLCRVNVTGRYKRPQG